MSVWPWSKADNEQHKPDRSSVVDWVVLWEDDQWLRSLPTYLLPPGAPLLRPSPSFLLYSS